MVDIVLTVDLEPDCPPFLDGWRGMREGTPRLLDLLEEEGVPATFFTTSRTAEVFPGVVEQLVEAGHELGCHGRDHRPFTELLCEEAEEEIAESAAVLREFAPVASFRAPYLRFPEAFVPFLEAHGFQVDASRAAYKPAHWIRPPAASSLARLVASTTSSVLRLPALVRDRLLLRLRPPVVLFVHPWELVDLRRSPVRWDCRFNTGPPAVESLREVVRLFRDRREGRFLRALDAAGARRPLPEPVRV
jgi:peptidoglycan/xylan/chitin deacetylase (PgdA/CDA1 family)